MLRKTVFTLMLVALSLTVAVPVAFAARGGEGGRGDGPVIYVRSQGLFFDSIVTADPLPQKGPFHKLEVVNGQLETDFGPGDHGYVGGRWWLDLNGNGVMDPAGEGGDKYFSCPSLGPGRETP